MNRATLVALALLAAFTAAPTCSAQAPPPSPFVTVKGPQFYLSGRPYYFAGANFWASGGAARSVRGQTFWKAGDSSTGDPPMEEQGLNSAFDGDAGTWKVIGATGKALAKAGGGAAK